MPKHVDFTYTASANAAFVSQMREADLADLERAIEVRRLDMMAARLEANGFQVRTRFGPDNEPMTAILVYDPGSPGGAPAEWATVAEARRLLDTVANLPHAEAFRRWRQGLEPVAGEEAGPQVQELNDKAALRREREQARADYQVGKIDHAALRDAHAPRLFIAA